MPNQPLSEKEWTRRRKVIEQALKKGYVPPGKISNGKKGAIAEAAESIGLSPAALQNGMRVAKAKGYKMPDWSLYKQPRGEAIEERTPDTVRTKNQIADLRKKLEDSLKYSAKLEDIRSSIFNLQPDKLSVPTWQVPANRTKSQPEIPTLFTSDFQAGEVIRSSELDFPNDYNQDIFRERYRRLIRTTVKLLERENPKMDYPGMVYLRGGDAVSGSIHLDLEATDEGVPSEQTKLVVEEEIRGLEELLRVVPKVTVYSVPGNHDRTTFKPRSKRYTALSYDYLAIWAMESYFRAKGESRITFSAPPSGDAYFAIFNTNYLLTHGDRIGSRGGAGFIGPAANISKGIFKVRQQLARMGRPVDYVLTGHFHVAMNLPNGIANGCLAGFSEYAKTELRAEPEPPTQTLWWTHPKWGLTTIRRVRVDQD